MFSGAGTPGSMVGVHESDWRGKPLNASLAGLSGPDPLIEGMTNIGQGCQSVFIYAPMSDRGRRESDKASERAREMYLHLAE